MKIWFDLTNSPHVNFFAGMIRDMEKDHELIITCRPLANTMELLRMNGLSGQIVGRHYGRNSLMKAAGFGIRLLQLYRFLRSRKPDVAISHSSFYSPVVARMLGARSLYLNDNEHADGNRISFRYADCVMIPEFLDPAKVCRQGADPDKLIRYPGVKEGVYLWQCRPSAGGGVLPDSGGKPVVCIRPEPRTAQYYSGKVHFIDELLIELKERYSVVLLPRGEAQANHYRHERFRGIFIPAHSIALADIMGSCDLFIGAGGTMTREAAVLGIPTISTYQDELLDVDRYLLANGYMSHEEHLDARYVADFLKKSERREPDRELLVKGKAAYELIKAALLGEVKEEQ